MYSEKKTVGINNSLPSSHNANNPMQDSHYKSLLVALALEPIHPGQQMMNNTNTVYNKTLANFISHETIQDSTRFKTKYFVELRSEDAFCLQLSPFRFISKRIRTLLRCIYVSLFSSLLNVL